jgi:hypothetical protein
VELLAQFGVIVNEVAAALQEHEKRLQLVETEELRAELAQMETKIRCIHDLEKQAQASAALKNLAELFGISDFSDC